MRGKSAGMRRRTPLEWCVVVSEAVGRARESSRAQKRIRLGKTQSPRSRLRLLQSAWK